jgi:hypothetical protein
MAKEPKIMELWPGKKTVDRSKEWLKDQKKF